ncbi:MAG: SDR family oxidoreductase [Candidatus Omnitrophota bacterium]|jgi:nucleoside-diphosphate-sugar epimerase|nr:MAG: SDR family oxidoreductase [Candidatus Omnitrophota bacterium]
MDTAYLKGKQVLVTGGAGFIGSNLTTTLLETGAKVRCLDNLSTGKLENLENYIADVEFIEGDIRDESTLKRALSNTEVVFHQAALPSVPRSIEDPLSTDQVNAQGTLRVLLASREAAVIRVVYASSSSVYGGSPTLPKVEDMPVDPKSPYALSKYSGERYCQLFHRLYGLETVCLRYFNVFGPRQDPTSQYAAVIPRFITHVLKGEPITIYGDGSQTRDFSFIDNVVSANILAASASGAAGEIINIACGQRITVRELAEFIMGELGKEVGIDWERIRPGEVRDSLASISKAKYLLGYHPQVNVWEGIRKTIFWFGRDIPSR